LVPPASAGSPFSLLTFSDVASSASPHLADSEFIVGHYRVAPGFRAALHSLFRVHNETANIFTHAAGFVLCAWLLRGVVLAPADVGLAPAQPRACAGAPVWPLAVFLVGALVCLGASVAFHTFAPVSAKAFVALAKADYAGISALIFTSMVPPLVYSFWDDAHSLRVYLALAAATNGVAAAAGTLDRFRSSEWRAARAAAFVACGLVGGAPLLHALWRSHQPDTPPDEHNAARRAVWGTLVMGTQYLLGALLYAARIPERYWPGWFDLFGSHAIFHVLVVTAVSFARAPAIARPSVLPITPKLCSIWTLTI
jgi:adiponectin receptor